MKITSWILKWILQSTRRRRVEQQRRNESIVVPSSRNLASLTPTPYFPLRSASLLIIEGRFLPTFLPCPPLGRLGFFFGLDSPVGWWVRK